MPSEMQDIPTVRPGKLQAIVGHIIAIAVLSIALYAAFDAHQRYNDLLTSALYLILPVLITIFYNDFLEQNSATLNSTGISMRKGFRKISINWNNSEIYFRDPFVICVEGGGKKIEISALYYNRNALNTFLKKVAAKYYDSNSE